MSHDPSDPRGPPAPRAEVAPVQPGADGAVAPALSSENADGLMEASRQAGSEGDHRAGLALAQRALQVAATQGTAAQAGAARELVALHAMRLGQHGLCLSEGRLALHHFEQVGDLPAQSRLHSTLCLSCHMAELLSEALAHANTALHCARTSGDERAQCWALIRLAMVHRTLNDLDRWREFSRQAIELARRLDSNDLLFAALHNRANALTLDTLAGQAREPDADYTMSDALVDASEALLLAQSNVNRNQQAVCHNVLGRACTLLGRLDQAEQHLRQAMELSRLGGFRGPRAMSQAFWAQLMQTRGQHAAAMAAYAGVLDDPEGNAESTLAARRALCDDHRRAGRLEQALQEQEQIHALQMRMERARSDRQLHLMSLDFELTRARESAERARLDADLQRLRAEEADRLANRLESQRGELERLVGLRTAELRAAVESAEAANRAKSTFLATISHELRTPLNGILGMTELALGRTTDPDQARRLRTSIAAARHLAAVIDDILEFTQLESRRISRSAEAIDLHTLASQGVDARRPAAQAKGLVIELQVAPEVPPRLWGDAPRLRRIQDIYLDNAIKFSKRGRIVVQWSATDEGAAGLRLRLDVIDQGIGIAAEPLASLFQPFIQADGSDTRAYGGAGLGLAIARRLADVMGGTTGATSHVGLGSTFWATALVRRERSGPA